MVSPYRDEAEDEEQRPPRYELRADESVLATFFFDDGNLVFVGDHTTFT